MAKRGNSRATYWYLLGGDVEMTGIHGSKLRAVERMGKSKLGGARGSVASWGVWRQELSVATAAMLGADIDWLASGNDRLAMACQQAEK